VDQIFDGVSRLHGGSWWADHAQQWSAAAWGSSSADASGARDTSGTREMVWKRTAGADVRALAVLFGQHLRLRLASMGRTDVYTVQHCAIEAPPVHTASALHSVWCREVYSFAPFHSDFTCLPARSSTNWLCSCLTKLPVVDPTESTQPVSC
jgi:hypothetical protein